MYDAMPECLSGLLGAVDARKDLIFVDNGSGGELTEWARRKYPGITVLTREENGHYCGGFNEGLQFALDGDYNYVAVVNADARVYNPDFLRECVEAMERLPQVAFLGPQVFSDADGTLQNTILVYPNILRAIAIWLPYRLFPRNNARGCVEEQTVDFLNGVCVVCRCVALKDFGILDESFGGYVEDTDWSWRAREKGWESVFTPIPSIIHEIEPHGYSQHSAKVFLLKRNVVYWYLKVGKRSSARVYAAATLWFARLRWLGSKSDQERHAKACFIRELRSEYQRLFESAKQGIPFSPLPMDAFKRLLAVDC
jgi:GT2 family glycosyltransferase